MNKKPYIDIAFVHEQWLKKAFVKGRTFVETPEGWVQIDTAGNVLVSPLKLPVKIVAKHNFNGHTLFFTTAKLHGEFQQGIWNTQSGVVKYGKYEKIFPFREEILLCQDSLKVQYITSKGVFIHVKKNEGIQKANIDYMLYGSFYAGLAASDSTPSGGWYQSDRAFHPIKNTSLFETDKLNLVLRPQDTTSEENIKHFYMYIANLSEDSVFFDAQDSRLDIWLQAQDKDGNWRDIQYLMGSWCGNSYHSLHLPPDMQWDFKVPEFDGVLETKLRAKLEYKTRNVRAYKLSDEEREEVYKTLYSNEVPTKINAAQFWRHQGYSPSSIMDPYID